MKSVFCVAFIFLTVICVSCLNNPHPPEEGKAIIYSALFEDPKTLDPVECSDTNSSSIVNQIYDCLYQYSYLERPYKVEPCMARDMPTVSDDGLTYTFRLKQGVHFHDNPCFVETAGKGREVVIDDFIYALKRIADPNVNSTGWWLFKGRIEGLDEFQKVNAPTKDNPDHVTDYSMPVAGIQKLGPYSVQLHLTEPFPQLVYIMALSYTALYPREAVEYYGNEFSRNPVGTGAFRLKEWRFGHVLTLEKNPTYRDDFYPNIGEPEDKENGLLDDAGKKLPLVDRIRLPVIRASQPMWLFFRQGYRDMSGISKDNFEEAITPGRELSEDFVRKGVRLSKTPQLTTFWYFFNMDDPIVGGDNKKLRQAMVCAYDTERFINIFLNGRGINAKGILPPGFFGYDPDLENPYKTHDLELARKLLEEAGYPGGRGSDGEPLKIGFDIGSTTPSGRQYGDFFRSCMADIGIDIEVKQNQWSEQLQKQREGRFQIATGGWIADYPDPENFLQLLYGPNERPGSNNANYANAEFDALYEKMRTMYDSPERLEMIRRMVEIINEDCPWLYTVHPLDYTLLHEWYYNFKPHGIPGNYLKYRRVDTDLRSQRREEWNRPNYGILVAGGGLLFLACVAGAMIRRRAPTGETKA